MQNRRPLRRWGNAVGTYSGCLLTKAEDKLIAMSGIARAFRLLLQDDHIAGLWRNHIIQGLPRGVHKDLNGEDKSVRRPQPHRGKISQMCPANTAFKNSF